MYKLPMISYPINSSYEFDGITFEYEAKIWMTSEYEITDTVFSSIKIFDKDGNLLPDYEITKSEIDNLLADSGWKALEKVQPEDFSKEVERE